MNFLKKFFLSLIIMTFVLIAFACCRFFIEPVIYNGMVYKYTAQTSGHDDIAIVVIDDKTIGKYRVPWPRDLNCKIFKYFSDYTNAKLIVHDSIILAPDVLNTQADRNYYNYVGTLNKFIAGYGFSNKFENDSSYDKIFKDKYSVKVNDERLYKPDDSYKSILKFPPEYFKELKVTGHVNAPTNADGYLTYSSFFIQYKGNLYPSLAMRAYLFLNDNEQLTVTDKYIIGEKSGLKVRRNYNKSNVSADLHFYKPKPHSAYSHKTYSAIDIMDSYDNLRMGKKPIIDPAEFDNIIVFVGANAKAFGSNMYDVKATPVNREHPGVDIQATALDNLLHGDFMTPLSVKSNILISLGMILMIFLFIKYNSVLPAISLSVVLYIIYCIVAKTLFKNGISVDVATPLFMGIVTMIFAYLYRFVQENINKEKVKNAMGKYISQDVMQKVVKNIDNLKLGGKKAVVTVLFADIRGFTSLSEKMEADEVSMILNEYFTEIEPIITKYNGVINKFIGDAVMAIFGEPIADERHAENAVKCANEMLETVKKLQHKWLNEGKPKIEIGIGINTGEVFLGNIGSEKRMEYTVIGDTVNLASRLESYNKIYKTNFLISSTTYAAVRNIADVLKISEVSIRGKSQKMNIYEVLKLIG